MKLPGLRFPRAVRALLRLRLRDRLTVRPAGVFVRTASPNVLEKQREEASPDRLYVWNKRQGHDCILLLIVAVEKDGSARRHGCFV
ncbi:hypothetical protein NLX67_12055 [Domibacillus sp. A3M-37]|uniref:hypothetical protein n=1 Tax=Domibacillus sp. A3M-37 TaxID=2962037 RepID=UPI0020B77FB6|nr:hypothetical protein [Domibacillus sp. A3M-37]MCP3763116.1 hypothetical protein [Domibacillus sp. A3M-37]